MSLVLVFGICLAPQNASAASDKIYSVKNIQEYKDIIADELREAGTIRLDSDILFEYESGTFDYEVKVFNDTVIDLNGHTLRFDKTAFINLIYYDTSTVTITDTSSAKSGRIVLDDSRNVVGVTLNSSKVLSSKLVLDGLNIEMTGIAATRPNIITAFDKAPLYNDRLEIEVRGIHVNLVGSNLYFMQFNNENVIKKLTIEGPFCLESTGSSGFYFADSERFGKLSDFIDKSKYKVLLDGKDDGGEFQDKELDMDQKDGPYYFRGNKIVICDRSSTKQTVRVNSCAVMAKDFDYTVDYPFELVKLNFNISDADVAISSTAYSGSANVGEGNLSVNLRLSDEAFEKYAFDGGFQTLMYKTKGSVGSKEQSIESEYYYAGNSYVAPTGGVVNLSTLITVDSAEALDRVVYTVQEGDASVDGKMLSIGDSLEQIKVIAKLDAIDVNGDGREEFSSDTAMLYIQPRVGYDIDVTNGKALVGDDVVYRMQPFGKVTINADTAPLGKVFAGWKVCEGDMVLEDAKSDTTSFVMPGRDVKIEAMYEDAVKAGDIFHGFEIKGADEPYAGVKLKWGMTTPEHLPIANVPVEGIEDAPRAVMWAENDREISAETFVTKFENFGSDPEFLSGLYVDQGLNLANGKLDKPLFSFRLGKHYTAVYMIQVDEGYGVAKDAKVTVNGRTAVLVGTDTGLPYYTGVVAVFMSYGKAAAQVPAIGKVTLKTTAYTFDNKAKKPGVVVTDTEGKKIASSCYTVSYSNNKAVGTATVTVKGKSGYAIGSKKASFTIKPKSAKLKKLSKGKRSLIAKWGKVSGVTGYQVCYSTSKKFAKKNTKTIKVKGVKNTSKTVKELKSKKTYYIKIRTYQKVKSKIYYSTWSKVKKIKVG